MYGRHGRAPVYHVRTVRGRTCVVTGATAGVGLETARGVARQGATVVIVGRDPDKCRTVVEAIRQRSGNPNVGFLVADLSVQSEIRRLAREIEARYPRLHVLVNNVGGLFLNGQVSADGIEMTLALNHLGPYLLTRLVCPILKASAPARVVNVASVAHLGARLDCADLRFAGWKGYRRSKLANILFTYELARRLAGTGVTANALSPGLVASNFGLNNRGLFPVVRPLWNWTAVSPERGARTSIYLATSPEVEGVSGKYFTRCRPRRSSVASRDPATAAQLWRVSASLVGLPAD